MQLLFFTQNSNATTFVNRPLKAVVEESSLVVRGRTGDSYSDWGKSDRSIYTYTYFYITEVIKGSLSDSKILLRQPGGIKDGIEMNVPGAAGFSIDEDVVLLLGSKSDDGSYDVPGLVTGKYMVKESGGKTFLENSLGGAAIYDANKNPDTLSYDARIPYDYFKKVAQNKVDPGTKTQFEPSKKAPDKKAFEADHEQHVPPKFDESKLQKALAEKQAEKQKPNPWPALSFIAFLTGGGFLLYRFLKKGGDV